MLAHAGASNDADDAAGTANTAALTRLHEVATNAPDNQSEYFALIGLAQAGGRRVGGELGEAAAARIQDQLMTLAGRSKGQKSPWTSLALGVFGRAQEVWSRVVFSDSSVMPRRRLPWRPWS
ncbi:MAG: hypothetical protein R3F49_09515 [Planctomycetota bacterium]